MKKMKIKQYFKLPCKQLWITSMTFFFEISHRRACRIRPGGSDPFDVLSNINIRSFNIWGLLKSSAETDPSTTDIGKHVEHFCVKFQRGKSVPVWCSVQNIHCYRLLACRYAELWTLLWYDWSHHWCVLHLWVSAKVNSVQKGCAKCFAVHLLRLEIL